MRNITYMTYQPIWQRSSESILHPGQDTASCACALAASWV